eukprot:361455-Chlamydomonas_euryale.AAC.6
MQAVLLPASSPCGRRGRRGGHGGVSEIANTCVVSGSASAGARSWLTTAATWRMASEHVQDST